MDNNIEQIHQDLGLILSDWKGICGNKELLEEEKFLEAIRSHILLLNDHLNALKGSSQIYPLLHHLLHTPPGAPIVSNKTLFECAKEYSSSDAKNSSLYHYLSRSLATSENKNNFLFNSIALLDEKLDLAA